MKVPFLYNRALAFLIAIPVVVLTVFLSGGGALKKERAQAADVFYSGTEGDGLSIRHDLDARLDAAYNMLIVAQRSALSSDPLLESILETHGQLGQDKSAKECFALDRALERDVKLLYDRSLEMALSDADQKLLDKQYTEFLSRGQTIEHDGYNRTAESFNRTLSGFPASLIGGVMNVKPLEYFR